MAIKIGIITGILLFLVDFFAIIPLGIVFTMGINSITGIPLYLVNYDSVQSYLWGTIDGVVGSWWIEFGETGIYSFALIQMPAIIACVLMLSGSFSKSEKGKKGILVSVIMLIMVLVVTTIDMLLGGKYLGISGAIATTDLLSALGMGYYLLIACIVLGIFTLKSHPDNVTE
ncbi:MAG: hypothetical protein GF364_04925 [Candidatus Lokiarchaeota archaeon]|nr:hypothetical protein [Candidatus Lokiarchaeota archaeon]